MTYDPAMAKISRAEFLRRLDQAAGHARSVLDGKPENFIPCLSILARTLEGEDGMVLMMLAVPSFDEDDEKHEILFQCGCEFYKRGEIPVAVYFECEAWIAVNPPPGVEPRHFAGRKEAIVIFGMSLDRQHQSIVSIPVRRDEEDRMIQDGPEPDFKREGAQTPLLAHFYRGFFDHVRRKFGLGENK